MSKKSIAIILNIIALLGFIWVFFMIGLYGRRFGWEAAFSIMIPALILSVVSMILHRSKSNIIIFIINLALLVFNTLMA